MTMKISAIDHRPQTTFWPISGNSPSKSPRLVVYTTAKLVKITYTNFSIPSLSRIRQPRFSLPLLSLPNLLCQRCSTPCLHHICPNFKLIITTKERPMRLGISNHLKRNVLNPPLVMLLQQEERAVVMLPQEEERAAMVVVLLVQEERASQPLVLLLRCCYHRRRRGRRWWYCCCCCCHYACL